MRVTLHSEMTFSSTPVNEEFFCRLVGSNCQVIVELSGQQMNCAVLKVNTCTSSVYRLKNKHLFKNDALFV